MEKSGNMERKISGKGWDGVLYPVRGRKDRIMIILSGSEGGVSDAKKLAVYLHDNGIPALALGYFRTKHSKKYLHLIPVEIIGSAIKVLKRLGYKRIGIEGLSKGAELALAAAVRYKDISCVILKTPSWFYSEGLKNSQPSGDCCWSFRGKALSYTPYKIRRIDLPKMIMKAKEFNILEVNTAKAVIPESVIPVEKVNGPILMLSSKTDTVWPSFESCEKMCARLKDHGFSYEYKHIAFDNMSHMMLENCSPIRLFFKSERNAIKACFAERAMMGRECVRWIEDIWK